VTIKVEGTMDGSLFARLSGELRNQVYYAYAEHPTPIEVELHGDKPLVKGHPSALAAACQQIRNEYKGIFEAANPSATLCIYTGMPSKPGNQSGPLTRKHADHQDTDLKSMANLCLILFRR